MRFSERTLSWLLFILVFSTALVCLSDWGLWLAGRKPDVHPLTLLSLKSAAFGIALHVVRRFALVIFAFVTGIRTEKE